MDVIDAGNFSLNTKRAHLKNDTCVQFHKHVTGVRVLVPYTAIDGTCKTSYTTVIPQGGVTGYKSVGQSTDALKSAIQNGSVSVAIEADQMAFQLYSGGIPPRTRM